MRRKGDNLLGAKERQKVVGSYDRSRPEGIEHIKIEERYVDSVLCKIQNFER